MWRNYYLFEALLVTCVLVQKVPRDILDGLFKIYNFFFMNTPLKLDCLLFIFFIFFHVCFHSNRSTQSDIWKGISWKYVNLRFNYDSAEEYLSHWQLKEDFCEIMSEQMHRHLTFWKYEFCGTEAKIECFQLILQ